MMFGTRHKWKGCLRMPQSGVLLVCDPTRNGAEIILGSRNVVPFLPTKAPQRQTIADFCALLPAGHNPRNFAAFALFCQHLRETSGKSACPKRS